MANRWNLKVEVDCPEPRPGGSRLLAAADGTTLVSKNVLQNAPVGSNPWEGNSMEALWQCPATGVIMLAPLPTTPQWKTNYAGNYARLRLTDFFTYTGVTWKEHQVNASGDYYLEVQDAAGSLLTAQQATINTTLPLAANTPMYFSFYVPPVNSTTVEILIQFRFGQYANANRVEVQLLSDGSVLVFKGGKLSGSYNKGNDDLKAQRTKTSNASVQNGYKNLMILPYKNREILIWSSDGFAINHIFNDLPNSSGNTILPNDKLYIYMPNRGTKIQSAIVKFATSGWIYGSPITWKYAPPTGATFSTKAYYTDCGIVNPTYTYGTYGIVKSDLSAYTPNGVDKDVTCKVTWTGDGNGSIAVECVDVWYDPPLSSTANAPIDITTAVKSLTMSVEENGAAKIQLTAIRKDLIDLAVPNYQFQQDRPVRLALGDGATPTPTYIDFFRGTLKAPTIMYEKGDPSAIASLLTYDGVDRLNDANTMFMFSAVPYDGSTFQQVLQDLWLQCGYNSSYLNVSTSTFTIPRSSDIGKGKYSFIPEWGDTCGKKIDDLHSTYAATWLKGWFPSASGYKYNFLDRSTLSTTPKISLYNTWADAIADGVPRALAHNRIIFEREFVYEPPEATAVSVIGYDPGVNQLIRVSQRDSAAEDPTLAPASRPRNWAGRPIDYILTDPGINSLSAANTALSLLYTRLTQGRNLLTVKCEFLVNNTDNVPIWIGDVVKVWNPSGLSSFVNMRVISIPNIEFVSEDQTNKLDVRYATYVLEQI